MLRPNAIPHIAVFLVVQFGFFSYLCCRPAPLTLEISLGGGTSTTELVFHPDVDDPYELAAAFAHDFQLNQGDASALEKGLLSYKSSVDGISAGITTSQPYEHHLEIRSSALGAAIAAEGRNGLEVWVDGQPHSLVVGPEGTPRSAADAFADAHSINNDGRAKLWAELSVLWKRTEDARNAQLMKEKAQKITEQTNHLVAQGSEDIIAVKLLVNEIHADLAFRLGDHVREAAQFWCNEMGLAGGDDVIDFVVGEIEQAMLNLEKNRNSSNKEKEMDFQNDTEEEFCPLLENGYDSNESFWPINLLSSWSLAITLLLVPLGALLQRRWKCCSVS